MADILSYSLRSTFAKEFYQSLTDPASDDRYYMAYGRIKPWDGDTPTTVDTIKEQNEFKRNTAFYQRILPSDVCLMVPRYDWTTGVVYDQYEDDVQLWADAKQYYVLVQDGDQYNVYICLYNNDGGVSTQSPSGTDVEEILLADGYIWKYLYTLTLELEEFLTLSYMPVIILDRLSYNDERALALNVKSNATSGLIENITIDAVGDFSDLYLVNTQLTTSHQVSTVDGLTFTAQLTSDHNSTNNYYDTNYVVYFESGLIGTIETYTISDNTVTITLCELYPDDGTDIETGDNYSILPKVKITGNGTGAVAVPVFDISDVLTSINVINGGQNYNFAETFFLVNSGAVISAVIPPKGGHGYDAVNELKPTHILIKKDTDYAAIPDDQEKYFGSGTHVRQLGIVRNITTDAGTNPDEQIDEYDMVLKFDGEVSGTEYIGNTLEDYTIPYFRNSIIITASSNSSNLTYVSLAEYNDFFKVGDLYKSKDRSSPEKQWTGRLVSKRSEPIDNSTFSKYIFTFEQDSLSGIIKTGSIDIENVSLSQTISFNTSSVIVYNYLFTNIENSSIEAYLNLSNFNNTNGELMGAFNSVVNFPVFNINDIIQLKRLNNIIGTFKILEIITPGYSSVLPFNGQALPPGATSTTFRMDLLDVDLSITNTDSEVFLEPDFIVNFTQSYDLDLLQNADTLFSSPINPLYFKDKQNRSVEITFSSQQTASSTAPTHILGNDTLSIAKINSLVVDTQDNTKFNLKITEPTGDFESATIEEGTVVSCESITLLRGTPITAFTRSFEKIGNTDSVYVLSENFDINNPANIPTTITSSVVSKLQVKRTGNTVLNNSIIPVGSYLYREATDTVDAAAAYVISIDEGVTVGSDATMYVYVQMEKGSFSTDDGISCVQDPFVKDITLYDGTCAGNSGVTITISETEQRYDNLFLNKYSGEVLYIQNTDPIQMATDTHFTTRILLGF